MTKTEELVARHQGVSMQMTAGDVIVVYHKQTGDPYITILLTPILLYDGGEAVAYASSKYKVSRHNHRVLPLEYKVAANLTKIRLATDEERQIYFQAISDKETESLLENITHNK